MLVTTIIVLAGLHNNPRSQTQKRLDEGFLGYETSHKRENLREIGVGTIDQDIDYVLTLQLTDSTMETSKNQGPIWNPSGRKTMVICCQKNKSVLTALNRWIEDHVTDQFDPQENRRIVTKLPLLMIDDKRPAQ